MKLDYPLVVSLAALLNLSAAAAQAVNLSPIQQPNKVTIGDGDCPPDHICLPPPDEPCAYATPIDAYALLRERIATLGSDLIYIGGAKYSANKSDFIPEFETRVDTCPGQPPLVTSVYSGYSLELPVYGDSGQQLHFDIAGRAAQNMTLTVSCGSFSATDSGNKFYISRSQVTGGSCTNMSIHFSFPETPIEPSYLELSVIVSETL
ncbi:hypothetical protein ACFOEE_14475 [Pseudoalteromonas fenneropenaei]|uniref:Secreted protein n=1 Tax=Pseudoalteromonas fenneropenaei TaxID=1737459 RepID=A0ABV7CMC9_9GAMM